MSFHFEYYAADPAAACKAIPASTPPSVAAFIEQAVTAVVPGQGVHVKAVGHLFNDNYTVSNAEITVTPIVLLASPPPESEEPAQAAGDQLPEVSTGILYTARQYPCGCKAEGPGDVPAYCGTHGAPPAFPPAVDFQGNPFVPATPDPVS